MSHSKAQEDWVRVAVRLPREVHEEVVATAVAEDRSVNGQISAFCKEGLAARARQRQTTDGENPPSQLGSL